MYNRFCSMICYNHVMNEDRPGIRTVVPDRPVHDEPGIQTKYTSQGAEFWNIVPANVRAINAPIIEGFERYLLSFYPSGYVSPGVRRANRLTLEGGHDRQVDHESCSYHASANALRILGGADTAYTKAGLKRRLEQIYNLPQHGDELTRPALVDILKSGQPYNKFEALQVSVDYDPQMAVPAGMHELLAQMYNGAVLLDSWPYTAHHTMRNGVYYTHARTIAGFTTTNNELFFHIVDPYEASVKPWSFRDLITAKRFQYANFPEGLKAKDVNHTAKEAWIVRKKSPIITTKRS